MYKTLNEHLKEKFGSKVYKLAIDGGFTCPNRDGTVGSRGCIFCSECGSGEFAEKGDDILLQLERAKKRVEHKNKSGKYIAYFQSFTNTYAPCDRLERLFKAALSPDYIVGLSVATRPDCLPDDTVELLKGLNKIKPVTVELGLQTVNEQTVKYIRRGYQNAIYFDAVKRLKAAGLEVVTHVMIGLPFEDVNDAVRTTRAAVESGTDGIKFHMLYVLKNTDLAAEFEKGAFNTLTIEQYAKILKECISLLPKHITVHRITGDGAKRDLIAPLWSADKKRTLNFLNNYLKEG